MIHLEGTQMKLNLNGALQNHKLNNEIKGLKGSSDLKNADEKKLKEACADFESIFMEMTLKSMRSTLTGDAIFKKGIADDIYQSMYDQKLSENIARGDNNLGLGESLYKQLSKNKGSISIKPHVAQEVKTKK